MNAASNRQLASGASRRGAVDRERSRRVPRYVTRAIGIGAALAFALGLSLQPACGGKSKNGKTTADKAKDNKDPKGMEDVGPEMGDNVTTTQVGGGRGAKAGGDEGSTAAGSEGAGAGEGAGGDTGAGAGGEGAGGPAEAAKPPEIKPPMLDIDPAKARAQVQVHIKKARAALDGANKDPNTAIKETKAALAIDPSDMDAVALLAHAYYFKKLDDTAEVLLDLVFFSDVPSQQKAARANPNIWYVYGLVYDRQGLADKARLYYEEALKRNPTFANALLNLGVHYLSESRFADAIRIYEQLTGELKVRTPTTWTNLGSAYRGRSISADNSKAQRDDWLKKAENAYKKAVSLDKNYANAYYDLGLLYFDATPFPAGNGSLDELKRLERAKTYFDEYRHMPGANLDLVDERTREVAKLIKKEQKRRKKEAKKKKEGGDDW